MLPIVNAEDNEAVRREFTLDKPMSAEAMAASEKRKDSRQYTDAERLVKLLQAYRNESVHIIMPTFEVYAIWNNGGKGRGNKRGHIIFDVNHYKQARQAHINAGFDGRLSDIPVVTLD
jgi:hypothetical protein